MWHVDDCIMVVAPWTNSGTLSLPEISTIPAWVTLKNIPSQLYSIPAIEWIASGLGEPMLSHKPWLDPTMIGEAKIMVEVELDKPFPQKIAAWDKQGNYSMVDVEYSWLPSKCEKCGQLGHKAKRCLSLQKTTALVHEKRVYVDTEQEQAPSTSYQTNGYREPVATTSGTISTSDEIAISATETTAVDGITPASHSSPAIDTTNNSTKAVQTFSILPPASGTVSPPTSLDGKESNKIDRVTTSIADGLMALADITELENMYVPPAFICINEDIDPLAMDSARASPLTVRREVSDIVEPDLGSNQFASLCSLEGEEEDQSSSLELNSMDLMTPFGKRILRERPVKPSTKAKEMHLEFTGRGRGIRGRGNKRGKG
ncbi:hypothetical protein N665_8001s0001 [Sinapis alba]|nr:hypothetical protein N665_8001s0001 [Sinapis alba]